MLSAKRKLLRETLVGQCASGSIQTACLGIALELVLQFNKEFKWLHTSGILIKAMCAYQTSNNGLIKSAID